MSETPEVLLSWPEPTADHPALATIADFSVDSFCCLLRFVQGLLHLVQGLLHLFSFGLELGSFSLSFRNPSFYLIGALLYICVHAQERDRSGFPKRVPAVVKLRH
jgi:hypothetical protein